MVTCMYLHVHYTETWHSHVLSITLIHILYFLIRILEGAAHNLPDASAEYAAREILSLARGATEDELLIALISGGGSALLPCPVEGVTLDEKRQVGNVLKSETVRYI